MFSRISDHRCSYLRLAPALGYPVALVDRRVLEAASISTQLQVSSCIVPLYACLKFERSLPSRTEARASKPPSLFSNPFAPKSDQCQISPAASPETLHRTVWRTWLSIAYLDERWLYYQFAPTYLYISILFTKVERMYFLNLNAPHHTRL